VRELAHLRGELALQHGDAQLAISGFERDRNDTGDRITGGLPSGPGRCLTPVVCRRQASCRSCQTLIATPKAAWVRYLSGSWGGDSIARSYELSRPMAVSFLSHLTTRVAGQRSLPSENTLGPEVKSYPREKARLKPVL
jgi:hypothetical protein